MHRNGLMAVPTIVDRIRINSNPHETAAKPVNWPAGADITGRTLLTAV